MFLIPHCICLLIWIICGIVSVIACRRHQQIEWFSFWLCYIALISYILVAIFYNI